MAVVQDKQALIEQLKANVPFDLRDRRRWVVWRYEDRANMKTGDLRRTKVPYQCWLKRSSKARINDPETWGYFGDALTVLEFGQYDGLLFAVVREDPYSFVDFDHCRDPESGQVEEWALRWVRALRSYTEISPSGTGLHVMVRGVLPERDHKTQNIEMYDTRRFATFTGHLYKVAE